MKYDLTHLAMVGPDGIPVFLIPSATPDQAINQQRKNERNTILRAINLHDALLQIAKDYSGIMETEYSDFKEKKRVDEIIAQAEVRS